MDSLDKILSFRPDGKLEKVCLAGFPNLLHEWNLAVDLGGKFFRPAGWDECFPTIEPYQGSPVMGELIGLSPEIYWQADSVEQLWHTTSSEARRRFSLETGSCLVMSFQVTNQLGAPLEFLWASHALFSVASLAQVRLSDGSILSEFDNDGSEAKFFCANTKPIELVTPRNRAILTTDQPWWGIWLNRGGWPVGSPHPMCCLGLEATNTPGEYPNGQWLDAGAVFSGKVRIEIVSS